MASIQKYTTKAGDKKYCALVYLGIDESTGKQINKKKQGFRTQKEARAWAERVRVEYAEKGIQTAKKAGERTYRDLYNEWLLTYKPTVAASTYLKTVEAFEYHILPIFGDMRSDKISPQLCRMALARWQNQLKDYKKIYQRAKKIYPDPWQDVSIPTVSKKRKFKIDEFWEKEELNAFLEACKLSPDLMDYPFFRLMAYTGVRRGEILALEWKHFDYVRKLIFIEQALTRDYNNQVVIGEPKTIHSIRTIPIDKETVDALVAWHEMNPGTKYIFESTRTGKYFSESMPRKHLHTICDTFGIRPIKVHGIRHTHCSLLFEAGMTPKEVQMRLGHDDIKITLEIYTHVSQKRQNALPDAFANFMGA